MFAAGALEEGEQVAQNPTKPAPRTGMGDFPKPMEKSLMEGSRNPHPSCFLVALDTPSQHLGHPQNGAGSECWRSLDFLDDLDGSHPVDGWCLRGVYSP